MGRRRHRRQFFSTLFLIFLLQFQLVVPTLASTSSHDNAQNAIAEQEEGKGGGVDSMMLRKTPLGSRPPSCEGRCRSSCGRRCEAVQVPVTPHDLLLLLRDKKKETLREAGAGARSGGNHGGGGVVLPSSYNDLSNYKPLGWRCKCLHS